MLQAGWIRTLLPIRENWIAVRAPTLQSRPILTSAPITAPAPITVPAPISTLGPITASGSTMTPSSRWADGSMIADGAMPSLSNQDCGRSASACHSRASFTKARNGWRGPQHRHMGGHLGLEARADQAGAGLGRLELIGVFEVVEKRQMHGTGFVERSEAPDHLTAPSGVDQYRSRQRGQFGQRRGRRLLEEYRLRHSTRRSPAGLHIRAPAPKKRSRPLLLFRGVLVTRTLRPVRFKPP